MHDVTPNQFTSLFPSLALGLEPDGLAALLQVLEYESLNAGETLIAEGTDSDALYLVWSGSLAVAVATAAGEQEVGRVGPGALLGEVSLMDPGPASATVRSDLGCTALVLPRQRLEELWTGHPRVAAKFLQQIAREVAQRIRQNTIQLNRTLASAAGSNRRGAQAAMLVAGGN